jgi:hypothetical protein
MAESNVFLQKMDENTHVPSIVGQHIKRKRSCLSMVDMGTNEDMKNSDDEKEISPKDMGLEGADKLKQDRMIMKIGASVVIKPGFTRKSD